MLLKHPETFLGEGDGQLVKVRMVASRLWLFDLLDVDLPSPLILSTTLFNVCILKGSFLNAPREEGIIIIAGPFGKEFAPLLAVCIEVLVDVVVVGC